MKRIAKDETKDPIEMKDYEDVEKEKRKYKALKKSKESRKRPERFSWIKVPKEIEKYFDSEKEEKKEYDDEYDDEYDEKAADDDNVMDLFNMNKKNSTQDDYEDTEEKGYADRLKAFYDSLEADPDESSAPTFVGDIRVSREKWHGCWGYIKVVAYFLAFTGGFFVYNEVYDKKPCTTGSLNSGADTCLLNSKTQKCVGYDDSACKTECQVITGEGCLVNKSLSGDVYQCLLLSEFEEACTDPESCSDSKERNILDSVFYLAMLFTIAFVAELVRSAGMFHFSIYHHDDFKDMTRFQLLWFFITFHTPFLTQLLWMVTCGSAMYAVFHLWLGLNCKDSLTSSGTELLMWWDSSKFVLYCIITLVVSFLFGSIFRHIYKVRGELFKPSDDGSIRIPIPIDCRKQRLYDPPSWLGGYPRCFRGSFEACYSLSCCKCCTHLCHIFGKTSDLICGVFLSFGSCIAWTYKHRHFLGP